jgi:hypothetical protein
MGNFALIFGFGFVCGAICGVAGLCAFIAWGGPNEDAPD